MQEVAVYLNLPHHLGRLFNHRLQQLYHNTKESVGGSSSNQNAPTRPADPSPPNSIPPIDAEAMISQEKIKVLGIVVG